MQLTQPSAVLAARDELTKQIAAVIGSTEPGRDYLDDDDQRREIAHEIAEFMIVHDMISDDVFTQHVIELGKVPVRRLSPEVVQAQR